MWHFVRVFLFFFFFFFQAEDGIRDLIVTGVQTCALPICTACGASSVAPAHTAGMIGSGGRAGSRSEERRVGEEWRSRGAPYHLKKKNAGQRRHLLAPAPGAPPSGPVPSAVVA